MKDDATEKPALEYEQRSSAQLQRQYRRLMALTLLNTILLAGFIVGPSVGPMVKSQWQQFQDRREQRRQLATRQAKLTSAMSYTAPPDQVIYEENPDEAAKLLAQPHSAFRIIRDARVQYLAPHPWQPPVVMNDSSLPIGNPTNGLLFLHARRANPAAPERLVRVRIEGSQTFDVAHYGDEQVRRDFSIRTRRLLFAQVYDDDGTASHTHTLALDRNRAPGHVIWKRDAASDFEHGDVQVEINNLYRFYAGQADPNDPSHFTIDYELDGERNTIDGYLREGDFVELIPRAGAAIDRDPQGTQVVWDPATRPTGATTKPASDH